MTKRRKWHRFVFAIAGAYNICWGLLSMADPQWMFRFAGMPLSNYPEIFACLGMVIGLYGVAYLEVARAPERGWPIAAIGFAGKVLGPIGMVNLLWTGQWPLASVILCIPNDVIWWIPFGLYLIDAWPDFKRELRGDRPRPSRT